MCECRECKHSYYEYALYPTLGVLPVRRCEVFPWMFGVGAVSECESFERKDDHNKRRDGWWSGIRVIMLIGEIILLIILCLWLLVDICLRM